MHLGSLILLRPATHVRSPASEHDATRHYHHPRSSSTRSSTIRFPLNITSSVHSYHVHRRVSTEQRWLSLMKLVSTWGLFVLIMG